MNDIPRRNGLNLALKCLEGLSVGDAMGERFFGMPDAVTPLIAKREVPPGRWRWTDDTLMAASVVEVLARLGTLHPDRLAASFAERYDPRRGYGGQTSWLLMAIRNGMDRHEIVAEAFGGAGSFGNGAAMRAGPIGAFFSTDLDRAAAEAAQQSAVTHGNPEAAEGAIAVACAAAVMAASRGGPAPGFDDLLTAALSRLSPSRTAMELRAAVRLGPDVSPEEAAATLGSGQDVAAFDTVPFALWSAATTPDDFVETFWRTVAGLGDRDTTCAIACSVTAARVGPEGIPLQWLAAREPLPSWLPGAE